MDAQNILIYIALIISMAMNVFIYLKLIKKDTDIPDNSRTEAHIILVDRKLSEINSDIQYIINKIENIESVSSVELDEITVYVKNGMNIPEMAKKMNKSIKEVELMLKMRGLI